jgi:NAD(P)-dependent dehydrogenase (short-subunit alcohol dehydrogenase family)
MVGRAWRVAAVAAAVGVLLAAAPRVSRVQPLTRDAVAAVGALELDGRVAVVTGGTQGVGLEAARLLAERGAVLVVTGRSQQRADAAAASLPAPRGQKHEGVALDLAVPALVRACATALARLKRIDVLILNAGLTYGPEFLGPFRSSGWADGQEQDTMVASNHLGHALLLRLLMPQIEQSASRVVFVSSISHHLATAEMVLRPALGTLPRGRDGVTYPLIHGFMSYGITKLMNVLTARKLERELQARKSKASVVVCTPGFAATAIGNADRDSTFHPLQYVPLTRSARDGGAVLAYAATVPSSFASAGKGMLQPYWIWEGADRFVSHFLLGMFYNFVQEVLLQKLTPAGTVYLHRTSAPSYDEPLQDYIWQWSSRVVGLP